MIHHAALQHMLPALRYKTRSDTCPERRRDPSLQQSQCQVHPLSSEEAALARELELGSELTVVVGHAHNYEQQEETRSQNVFVHARFSVEVPGRALLILA
jgi:hypothetical protein